MSCTCLYWIRMAIPCSHIISTNNAATIISRTQDRKILFELDSTKVDVQIPDLTSEGEVANLPSLRISCIHRHSFMISEKARINFKRALFCYYRDKNFTKFHKNLERGQMYRTKRRTPSRKCSYVARGTLVL